MKFILILVLLVDSCALDVFYEAKEVTILSWNAQNLFDEVDDGTEYPEFDPTRGHWNRAQFWSRLERASEVILESFPGGPDILALQEIENTNVAQTLCDRYLALRGYRVISIPEPRCTVQTVFLTKLEPRRVHVLRQRDFQGEPLRNILEMEIEVLGRKLVILNNHWKSRQPSPQITFASRHEAGELLTERARYLVSQDQTRVILAVGDFNSELTGKEALEGWYLAERGVGSYWYADEWNRLDHCAVFGEPIIQVQADYWAPSRLQNTEGKPRRWSLQDKNGVSDHFPVLIRLVMKKNVEYTGSYGVSRFCLLP